MAGRQHALTLSLKSQGRTLVTGLSSTLPALHAGRYDCTLC